MPFCTLFHIITTFFFFVCFFSFPTQTQAEGYAGNYLFVESSDSGRDGKATRFEGSEHRAGANELGYLSFPVGTDGTDFISNYNNEDIRVNYSITQFIFTNANGVELGSYGDIVGLAGDFFGPSSNINYLCSSSSPEEGQNLFQSMWRQMWYTSDRSYVTDARGEFDKELQAIMNKPADQPAYEALGSLGEARWTKFLSAGEVGMASLLLSNFDHFGSCAFNAYKIVHQIAMNTARAAGEEFRAANFSDLSMDERRSLLKRTRITLIQAYAMNAFADHYMTDLFSAGHVRTPRKALSLACGTKFEIFKYASAGLAAQWMHDEDNRNGLLVTNKLGDVWTVYGDDNYWSDDNTQNRYMIRAASQASRNEVYNVFNGAPDSFQALEMVPDPDQLPKFAANNTCPLFIRDPSINNDVLIRTPIETIRPVAWKYINGETTCTYTPFTVDSCPTAEFKKISTVFKAIWGHTSLAEAKGQDGWYTTQAPYVSEEAPSSLITSDVSGRHILLTENICVVILTLIFLLNV